MADISAVFTLATPGGTVLFNSGTQSASGIDQIYISEISGLEGAPIRAPIDDIPFGHGGLSHDFWEGGRHMIFDGVFLITSTLQQLSILAIRNQFEEDLRVPLRSIAALKGSTGTLGWTPYGQSARQLTVRCDLTLDCSHEQDYLLETFHFGLYADDPDWDGWSS